MKRAIQPIRCARPPARSRENRIPSLLATLINKTAHRHAQDAYAAHRAASRALAARLLAEGMPVDEIASEITNRTGRPPGITLESSND